MAIDHSRTANSRYLTMGKTLDAVEKGIINASDAILTAETSLYRAGHRFRFDRSSNSFKRNQFHAVFNSPWWTTAHDFNSVTWATGTRDPAGAAKDALAVHQGWGGDCSLFASICLTTDLSVWFGIGKSVVDKDIQSNQLSIAFASEDILQIYIPGFEENAKKWANHRRVFPVGGGLSNGRGFQGHLPAPVSKASGASISPQMSLFDKA